MSGEAGDNNQTAVAQEMSDKAAEQAQPSCDDGDKDDEEWKVQRDHHKAQADDAFRVGGFRTAIDEYTKAISLDPDFAVAYSNRSAAYLRNSEKSKALKDAHKVVELDSSYAKGHSRLAAALHSLARYEQAKSSYEQVLKLDANNAAAKKGAEDCQRELDRIEEERKNAFVVENRAEEKPPKNDEATGPVCDEGGAKDTGDGGDDDDADDLLNHFFDDVEVVTTKKKELKGPTATNAIKHHKDIIGTFDEQAERLLKSNYEWRNLNAFYVMQLPVEATEEDISRRYKALALLLHPDKNGGSEKAQQAYDEVKKAKNILLDSNRAKHSKMLIEEAMKIGKDTWNKLDAASKKSQKLEDVQEKEVMRIFAQVELKRREVEERERKYEQRERKQEDDALEVERKARKFDKNWRQDERVSSRIGNWRDFASNKKPKK